MTRMSRTLRQGRRVIGALCVALLVPATACNIDDLLDVDTPSRIPAEQLETDPANATLLVNSVIGDFECGFGSYVVAGGLIGDELEDGTQTADRYPFDRRNVQESDRRYSEFGCTTLGVYTPLQSARATGDNVIRLLDSWTDAEVPNRADLRATASAYTGYSLILLGEGFCSMVVSTINADRTVAYGGEIMPDSVFELAIARLEDALTSSDASIRNMAQVGLARAHLNLGNYAEAQAAAEQVPADFERVVTASTTSSRRENKVWQQSSATSSASPVGELYRGLNDPRVPVVDAGRMNALNRPVFYQAKYANASSAIPLATWEEAQLIIAEAELEIGQLQDAVDILSAMRVANGQTAFSSTDPATVRAELIDQRRRELFLESHHLGDFRRYALPFVPAPGATYFGSGNYGDTRCLPLPLVERQNNPML